MATKSKKSQAKKVKVSDLKPKKAALGGTARTGVRDSHDKY